MRGPGGDIGRFIFLQQPDVIADRHFGGARHHHPMFGTMVMLLERQPGAGFDDDALGLEAVAAIGGLVGSPRAKHFGGADRRLVAALAQHVDRDLHVLRPLEVGHQHRVARDHYADPFKAERDHQLIMVRPDQAVLAVERQDRTLDDIAVRILVRDIPQ